MPNIWVYILRLRIPMEDPKKSPAPVLKKPDEHTRNIGKRGEEIAATYLLRSGYEIISTNWQIW